MILLIDIGNTLTKIALANETNKEFTLIKTIATKDDNWDKIVKKTIVSKKTKIDHAIIANVVPDKLVVINKIITAIFSFKPIVLNNHTIKDLPLKISKNYQTIGSDLIALAIASQDLFGNTIAISLGTATVYTIIKDNALKGVIIAPGFTSAKMALSNDAAQIKTFQISPHNSILANSTKDALSIGFGNGFNYMIDNTIKAINKELKSNLKVIITGGNFKELKPFFTFNYQYQDNLVLHGLIIIYQILKKNNKLK